MTSMIILGVISFELDTVLSILCIPVMVFSVYVIRSLVHLRKKGWILMYFILVLCPFIICLITRKEGITIDAYFLIPLALFYLYCLLLRYFVNIWLSDLGDEKPLEQRQKEENKFTDIWVDRF